MFLDIQTYLFYVIEEKEKCNMHSITEHVFPAEVVIMTFGFSLVIYFHHLLLLLVSICNIAVIHTMLFIITGTGMNKTVIRII
jgi:hypothetical protein